MPKQRNPFADLDGKSYLDSLAREEKAQDRETRKAAVASYRIGSRTKERVSEFADAHRYEKGDLVRVLLNCALDMVEDGTLDLDGDVASRHRKVGE